MRRAADAVDAVAPVGGAAPAVRPRCACTSLALRPIDMSCSRSSGSTAEPEVAVAAAAAPFDGVDGGRRLPTVVAAAVGADRGVGRVHCFGGPADSEGAVLATGRGAAGCCTVEGAGAAAGANSTGCALGWPRFTDVATCDRGGIGAAPNAVGVNRGGRSPPCDSTSAALLGGSPSPPPRNSTSSGVSKSMPLTQRVAGPNLI